MDERERGREMQWDNQGIKWQVDALERANIRRICNQVIISCSARWSLYNSAISVESWGWVTKCSNMLEPKRCLKRIN